MKWQEKLSVLKVAGCELYENPNYVLDPADQWRYLCEIEELLIGVGDTHEQAVNDAWNEYMMELENEKAS